MSSSDPIPLQRTLLPLIFAGLSAVLTAPARADIPGYPASVTAYDPREVAMLPEYCKYTQLFRDKVPGGNNPAEIKRWNAIIGDMFIHIHHYCWGMMKTNRAMILAKSKADRIYNLNDSIGEFDYVLGHATDDFVLLPEILTKRGENLMRLGRPFEAVRDLDRAIELKRDYWPPYGVLAEHYRSTGDVVKAREILKQGLAAVPNAPALRRQLAELSSSSDPSRVVGATR
jgi:tetratricopeptide (TPR) repeat protein